MAVAGFTADFSYYKYTPIDETGYYDIFRSGYKNLKFNVQTNQQLQLDASNAYNLPGLSYQLYGDTSLWYALLAFNGLKDPLTDVYPGLILLIPTKSDVVAYVSKQAANTQTSVTL